jgi:hypothetical protein
MGAEGVTTAGTASNTIADSAFNYTGSVGADGIILDVALNNFGTFSASTTTVWSLAAGDSNSRNRSLLSFASPLVTGPTNAQVKNSANGINSYISALNTALPPAGLAPLSGLTATSSDAWNANNAIFGDSIGGSGISGTSNALWTASNIYGLWSKSVSAGTLPQANAGFHTLTAGGLDIFGTTYINTTDNLTHFKLYTAGTVVAVPETNTWAMALLGVGFMGFIGRRRGNQA